MSEQQKRQMLTLRTPVALRLMRYWPGRAGGPEPFTVEVTHIVGLLESESPDGKRAVYTVVEVAWDKGRPEFHPLGEGHVLHGTVAPHAVVSLKLDNLKAIQDLN